MFCKVEALVDDEGNVLIDQNGDTEIKVPNPRVELLNTYLVARYVMHCPYLITIVHTSEDFVPLLQKLERSTWQHTYMFYIKRTIQSDFNYQLV